MKTIGTRLLSFQWKPPTSLSARTILISPEITILSDYQPVHNFIKFDVQVWLVILDKQLYWGLIHAMPEIFENAALFLWLGLPSTIIYHEKGHSSNENTSDLTNLNMPALCFNVDGKQFQIGAFPKWWCHDFLKYKSNVVFSNFSYKVCTENIWCVFRVIKTSFSNFSGIVWTGHEWSSRVAVQSWWLHLRQKRRESEHAYKHDKTTKQQNFIHLL